MTTQAGPQAVTTVDALVYSGLQQFYARQMQLLDQGAADEWAHTFTEDGLFTQNVLPQPWRGRAEIAARMRAAVEKLAEKGLTRRHWIGMLTADEPEPGTARTRYYAIVADTPRGGPASLHLSTSAEDVLVRDGHAWLVRRRFVRHDGTG